MSHYCYTWKKKHDGFLFYVRQKEKELVNGRRNCSTRSVRSYHGQRRQRSGGKPKKREETTTWHTQFVTRGPLFQRSSRYIMAQSITRRPEVPVNCYRLARRGIRNTTSTSLSHIDLAILSLGGNLPNTLRGKMKAIVQRMCELSSPGYWMQKQEGPCWGEGMCVMGVSFVCYSVPCLIMRCSGPDLIMRCSGP